MILLYQSIWIIRNFFPSTASGGYPVSSYKRVEQVRVLRCALTELVKLYHIIQMDLLFFVIYR